MLQAKDTDLALSVNWLEFFNLPNRPIPIPDRTSQVGEVRKILAKKMRVGSTSKLAELNVEHAVTAVREATGEKVQIAIIHDPASLAGLWDDPSHSGILGLSTDDDTPAVALAGAITAIHSAK